MPSPPRRTALVTGGSRRVGRVIVQTLADAGFDVFYTTRSAADAPPTGRVTPITLDITDIPQSIDAVQETLQQANVSALDVLVHNASIYEPATLGQTGIRMIRRMNRVHIEVPILLTRELTPLLKAARGTVIMMLDLLAQKPSPKYLAFSASKAAMANLTLSLARELAPEVTVNGIAPGVVEWPTNHPPDDREKYLAKVPLKRAGEPADAASLIKYLATEGKYITGQIIRVDGGRSVV